MDHPASLAFSGSEEAALFTREVAESFAGVLRENLIPRGTADGYPPGFVRASVPPRPWWDTMWTRDAGTFLRELVAWGYTEHACLVAHCLISSVARNADGFVAFPEKLRPGQREAGDEVDGTAAIIIGMVLLWRHLPENHPFRSPLYGFLHQPGSPVGYLRHQIGRDGLIAGTGEFGPGCSLDGHFCSVVQNNLAALALLAAATLEADRGDLATAARFRDSARMLENAMRHHMLAADGSWLWGVQPGTLLADPAVLNAPINRGSGLLNGVASMFPDVLGLEPLSARWPFAPHCLKTFDRLLAAPLRREQFEKYGFWPQWDPPFRGGLSSGPAYGEGYALQTMLLFDRLELADKALRWLARATHDAPPQPHYGLNRTSPYHFYERTYSPDALGQVELDEGCGALNLVTVMEPLKVARLLLGVDVAARSEVRLVPRLPQCVNRIEAKNWPLLTEAGVVRADLTVEREQTGGYRIECRAAGGAIIPLLTVRVPVSDGYRAQVFRDVAHAVVSSAEEI